MAYGSRLVGLDTPDLGLNCSEVNPWLRCPTLPLIGSFRKSEKWARRFRGNPDPHPSRDRKGAVTPPAIRTQKCFRRSGHLRVCLFRIEPHGGQALVLPRVGRRYPSQKNRAQDCMSLKINGEFGFELHNRALRRLPGEPTPVMPRATMRVPENR
jgi:hypothetical protein